MKYLKISNSTEFSLRDININVFIQKYFKISNKIYFELEYY